MTGGLVHSYTGGEGAASLHVLARDLNDLPAAVRRRVAPRLREAGQHTLRAAAHNAAWSTRIPGAMTLRTTTRGRNPGVMIVVDTGAAPHARVYEGIVSKTFRHPLFGIRGAEWYSQAARPYLVPAARETGGTVVQLVSAGVAEALADTVAR